MCGPRRCCDYISHAQRPVLHIVEQADVLVAEGTPLDTCVAQCKLWAEYLRCLCKGEFSNKFAVCLCNFLDALFAFFVFFAVFVVWLCVSMFFDLLEDVVWVQLYNWTSRPSPARYTLHL